MTYLLSNNKQDCTGCSACASICTHTAITMIEDSEGFLYPKIDKEKCVGCKLCEIVCPINGDTRHNDASEQIISLVRTDYEEYYLKSATVGVCTMLSQYALENGWIVFGSALDEKLWQASHISIKQVSEIHKIRGSKYFQSSTKHTFAEVKDYLKKGINVLYIGTPCQISGLKSFLRKNYENLFTIDLICHGTFSYKFFQKEVAYWEHKYNGKMSNFSFRNKKIGLGGVVSFNITQKGQVRNYVWPAAYSPVYRCFTANEDGVDYNLRPSCYGCIFHETERYGDLTIGDAWGIQDKRPELFDLHAKTKGISLVFENTRKGSVIMKKIQHLIYSVHIPLSDALSQPALVSYDNHMPTERKILYDNLETSDYQTLVESVLHVDFDKLQSGYVRKQRINNLKKIIKKIILNIK